MGFINFIKNTAKKIGSGISQGARYLGSHLQPIVHGISNVVEKVAPYASGIAAALGHPELSAPISIVGKIAGNIKNLTERKGG